MHFLLLAAWGILCFHSGPAFFPSLSAKTCDSTPLRHTTVLGGLKKGGGETPSAAVCLFTIDFSSLFATAARCLCIKVHSAGLASVGGACTQ